MSRVNDRYIAIVVTERFKDLQFARLCKSGALEHTLEKLRYGCPFWLRYEVIVESDNPSLLLKMFRAYLVEAGGVHPVTSRSYWFVRNDRFDDTVNRWLHQMRSRGQIGQLSQEEADRWIEPLNQVAPEVLPAGVVRRVKPIEPANQ